MIKAVHNINKNLLYHLEKVFCCTSIHVDTHMVRSFGFEGLSECSNPTPVASLFMLARGDQWIQLSSRMLCDIQCLPGTH